MTLKPPTPSLRAPKGAILVVDQEGLRERGLFKKYAAQLASDPVLQERILHCTVSDRIDVPAVMAHYAALDALGLSHQTAFDFGKQVGERVHGEFLRVLIKLAGKFGADPWRALAQAEKLWKRSWEGGALLVVRESNNSARFTVEGMPPSSSDFFRASLSGAIHAGVTLLCQRAIVTEDKSKQSPTSFEAVIHWN